MSVSHLIYPQMWFSSKISFLYHLLTSNPWFLQFSPSPNIQSACKIYFLPIELPHLLIYKYYLKNISLSLLTLPCSVQYDLSSSWNGFPASFLSLCFYQFISLPHSLCHHLESCSGFSLHAEQNSKSLA